jgi:hypothetical protein
MCHAILTHALVVVRLQCPVVPRACSLSSAAHGNHAEVKQSAKGPQLYVDVGAVSLAVLVDILPPTLANWTSQPRKTELVTLYKNE